MTTPIHSIGAGQFKARCLQLLDSVARTGQPLVVTKRGKPVARLVPLAPELRTSLLGSVVAQGDLVSPLAEDWEMAR